MQRGIKQLANKSGISDGNNDKKDPWGLARRDTSGSLADHALSRPSSASDAHPGPDGSHMSDRSRRSERSGGKRSARGDQDASLAGRDAAQHRDSFGEGPGSSAAKSSLQVLALQMLCLVIAGKHAQHIVIRVTDTHKC